MNDKFLSNKNSSFLNQIKDNLSKCKSFHFSVSFIKRAGLKLFEREIEEALERGVKGRIITSTYQNFTDISSLEKFYEWQKEYDNFECHLDFKCFGDNGFHTKGYFFEYDDSIELIIGSSNITYFALLKNFEWNISLISKDNLESYNNAMKEFEFVWNNTFKLDRNIIEKYRTHISYAIEKWDMDYLDETSNKRTLNLMQRKALREIRRYRDIGVKKALIISATGSGKTYLSAFDAKNFDAKKLLYIVHRESILKDAYKTFVDVFGAERTYGFYTGNESDLNKDFIFSTSSMLGRHLELFDKHEFDYIIFDEAHHIVADTMKRIFDYFEPEFILGLTATPERMDNQDIFSLFDQNVPFELRLRDAINNDLVVPFHYYGIRDSLVDYSSRDRMTIAKNIATQENIEFIKREIEKHRKPNEKLKCIAFCTNVQSCKLMGEELYEEGYHTTSLTGINDTGARLKAFEELQDDNSDLEIICTVDILNEGVDIPQLNMILFLRPTESQTIFIQQLGRGLRKYPGKDYVTVLDFIGNNYERSVQIAIALGSLGRTTYLEKTYLKEMVKSNFESLNIPGVKIEIDELSKEEIINYITNKNFNSKEFLEKDYQNFKSYINTGKYPTHMDFLNSDVSPDLMRIIKSQIDSSKNKSYYNFLKKIDEETIPMFTDEEIDYVNELEELLPLARLDEYIIIEQILKEHVIDLKRLEGRNEHVTEKSLKNAYEKLKKEKLIENEKLDISQIEDNDFKEYVEDTLKYGIARYEREFGDYNGLFKLYGNYYKEQASRILLMNGIIQKGAFYKDNIVYIFAGIKKDEEGRLNYKDKFINNKIFQWESVANISEIEKSKLRNAKKVHLFIRKMEREDGITLPYTYFGLGTLTNERDSYTEENGIRHNTLIFDILLDNEIPEIYNIDFEIPE